MAAPEENPIYRSSPHSATAGVRYLDKEVFWRNLKC